MYKMYYWQTVDDNVPLKRIKFIQIGCFHSTQRRSWHHMFYKKSYSINDYCLYQWRNLFKILTIINRNKSIFYYSTSIGKEYFYYYYYSVDYAETTSSRPFLGIVLPNFFPYIFIIRCSSSQNSHIFANFTSSFICYSASLSLVIICGVYSYILLFHLSPFDLIIWLAYPIFIFFVIQPMSFVFVRALICPILILSLSFILRIDLSMVF